MIERTIPLAVACWIGVAIAGDASVTGSLGSFSGLLWLVPILGSAILWRVYCRE